MDREAIYRETLTLQWVVDYLENKMQNLEYHKLLCSTHSDKPSRSWRYQNFLYSLPQIKLNWDRQPECTKQQTLQSIDARIQELHDMSTDSFPAQTTT